MDMFFLIMILAGVLHLVYLAAGLIVAVGYGLNMFALWLEYKLRPNATGEDLMGQSMIVVISVIPYLGFACVVPGAIQSLFKKRK